MPNLYKNKVVYGNTTIIDISDTTAVASDVASGKYFYLASGEKVQGTASGGGGMTVVETQDSHGGTIVTITGTAVTLQSKSNISPTTSSQTITPDEGYTGLSSVQINAMPSGSATTPATTVTANPSISVSSGGLITATASATKSVTPTVSAGYVSSGTAGTITVSGSNTSQLSTQAAATITPTKSSQTAVASGKYTTGAVTVAAIPAAYQDVTGVTAAAGDVVSGKTIVDSNGNTVNGSLVIQHYYTGTGTPSASLGQNGDIYLQTS